MDQQLRVVPRGFLCFSLLGPDHANLRCDDREPRQACTQSLQALMKVYVHHEAPPAFTKIVRVDVVRHAQLRDVLDEFVRAFNSKHPTAPPLITEQLLLHDADHKPLQLSAAPGKVLCEHCDVFVVPKAPEAASAGSPGGSTPVPQPSTSGTSAAAERTSADAGTAPAAEAAHKLPATGAAASINSGSAESEADRERERVAALLQQYVSKAQQAAGASNFRLAGEIYAQVRALEGCRKALQPRGRLDGFGPAAKTCRVHSPL